MLTPNWSFGSVVSLRPSFTLQKPVVEKQPVVQFAVADDDGTCQTTTRTGSTPAVTCPKSQAHHLGLPSGFRIVREAPAGQLELTGPDADAPTGNVCRKITCVSVEPLLFDRVAR